MEPSRTGSDILAYVTDDVTDDVIDDVTGWGDVTKVGVAYLGHASKKAWSIKENAPKWA